MIRPGRPPILSFAQDGDAPPRLVTLPACPSCGEAMRLERVRGNHDRPAVRFLACRCGHQEGHALEREGEAA